MKTPKNRPRHETFLVRAWLEQTNEDTYLWRFRVQNIRTSEWHSFADMASLTDYLQKSMKEDMSDEIEEESKSDQQAKND